MNKPLKTIFFPSSRHRKTCILLNRIFRQGAGKGCKSREQILRINPLHLQGILITHDNY